MVSWKDSLDQPGTLQRLNDLAAGTGWGGDRDDVYQELETVQAHWQVIDSDQYTIWLVSNTEPMGGDRLTFSGVVLDVERVKPYRTFDGVLHHYEVTAREVPTSQVRTHAGT